MAFLGYLLGASFLLFTQNTKTFAADLEVLSRGGVGVSILSKALLSAPYGGVVLSEERRRRVAEYCPDETCDRLTAPIRMPEEIFESLVFVFFCECVRLRLFGRVA